MNFQRSLIYALAVIAFSTIAGEGESELRVTANGLRVIGKVAGEDDSLRPFSAPAGTSVALLVSSEKGGLIQFDAESSALARFTDEKGNDLLSRPAGEKNAAMAGFSMFPRVSKDGKFCALEVQAPNAPAKGSEKLKLEGVITMLCATQKSENAQKDVALKNKTEFKVAGLELSLDNVGKPDFGDDPFGLTLRSHSKMDNVAEVKFFKADGTEIKSHQTGTSKMAILGSLTVEWSYSLAEKVDVATVKIYIWTDMQKKKVPFKLDVDVGL